MIKFDLLKIEKHDNYFSILLKDKKENISFWLDCSIEEDDDEQYINWEFNQYIFFKYDENDKKAEEYQENADNIDNITYYIDSITNDIIAKIKEDQKNGL